MDERKQIKIYVSPAAKDVIEQFSASFDMSELGVASRLYEWFGRQPVAVQKWIIGLADGTEPAAIGAFIDDLARMMATAERSAGAKLKRAAKPMPGRR